MTTVIGRYALHREIAAGGMATVYLGRLTGERGFSRTVAIKRLHSQYAKDPDFHTMFLDEARLAARIRHPNVVSTVDVVSSDDELFLVMDYVPGESLARLFRNEEDAGRRLPLEVSIAILAGALHGLHAAHEALDEQGAPLNVVHRDVSPQNILVGIDGIPRVLDFGVAKAAGRMHQTSDGHVKGKLAYMAPEQFRGETVTRTADIYAASIILWELLTGERRTAKADHAQLVERILYGTWPPPSQLVPGLPTSLDEIVKRGLARKPEDRYPTARDMALALEAAVPPARPNDVAEVLSRTLAEPLAERATMVRAMESASDSDLVVSAPTKEEPTTRDPPRSFEATGVTVVPLPKAPPRSQKGRFIAIALISALSGVGVFAYRRTHRPAPVVVAAPPPPAVVSVVSAEPEPPPAPTPLPTPSASATAKPRPKARPARSSSGPLPPGLPAGRD